MKERTSINELVRGRLRALRQKQGLGVSEVAIKAGLPVSSYASMEAGDYRLNLDNLFRILGALNLGIQDVWPVELEGIQAADEALYLRRIQELRFNEVLSLAGAEGGALLALRGRCASVIMSEGLSDPQLGRLARCLEAGKTQEGYWRFRRFADIGFHFYLRTISCPFHLEPLVRTYLVNWSAYFGAALTGK